MGRRWPARRQSQRRGQSRSEGRAREPVAAILRPAAPQAHHLRAGSPCRRPLSAKGLGPALAELEGTWACILTLGRRCCLIFVCGVPTLLGPALAPCPPYF